VPGQGTTVTLFLPTTDAIDPGPPDVEQEGVRGSGTVLYVEDNPDVAMTTGGLLEALGYRCEHAPDAERALARLQADPEAFTAVLSDISLPGRLDGIELATRLNEDFPRLRVVLMTGYSDRLTEAVARGLTVIAKPCEPRELSVAIRRGGQQTA
jgi:CheY-like chemotaxis protein